MRKLGSSGLEVSALGLGCMGLSSFYGPPTAENEAIALIHRAIDIGATFLDTAEIYGPFTNERLVGKAIRDRRDKVVVASKFAYRIGEDGARLGLDGSPGHIKTVIDAMLGRLGIETLDLLYQHRRDTLVPIEETIGAMGELVTAGKVRYLGLSEVGPQTIRASHDVHPIAAVQTEYSLWERDVEREILPALRELGIGFVAYSPLGRGFLTGALRDTASLASDDFRRTDPRLQGENLRANLALLERVEAIARDHGNTPAQIALAWLLQQGSDIVPIPGTTKIRRLEENVAAAPIALTPSEVETLDSIGASSGQRYSEVMLASIVRD